MIVPEVAIAGLIVCTLLACVLAVIEVRRSFRIVRRAQRIAALPEPEPEPSVDWATWDEVFS